MSTDELVRTASKAIEAGDFDRLRGMRPQMLVALGPETGNVRTENGAALTSFISAVSLLDFDKLAAARVLAQFVSSDRNLSRSKVKIRRAALQKLATKVGPFWAGVLTAEVVNFAHRMWIPELVADIAPAARNQLKAAKPPSNLSRSAAALWSSLSTAWFLRVEWQTQPSRSQTIQEIKTTKDGLVRLELESTASHGRYLVLAVLLDLLADVQGLDSEVSAALAAIHEARALLEYGGAGRGVELRLRDTIRLAHVLYTAGKLTRASSETHAALIAERLLIVAERLYPTGHPLSFRAVNQRARALLSSQQPTRCSSVVDASLASLDASISLTSDELAYARAELLLTKVYAAEQTSASDAQRAVLRDSAAELYSLRELVPPRLALRAVVQRALVESRYEQGSGGKALIEEAETILRNCRIPGEIRVAVALAHAEILIRDGERNVATSSVWRRAEHGVATVQSDFLKNWYRRLAAIQGAPLSVSITNDMNWTRAQAELKKGYFQYHYARTGGNVATIATASGLDGTYTHNLITRLGIRDAKRRKGRSER